MDLEVKLTLLFCFLRYVFCFVCPRPASCVRHSMLPVSLDCPFFFVPSIFSNVYLDKLVRLHTALNDKLFLKVILVRNFAKFILFIKKNIHVNSVSDCCLMPTR